MAGTVESLLLEDRDTLSYTLLYIFGCTGAISRTQIQQQGYRSLVTGQCPSSPWPLIHLHQKGCTLYIYNYNDVIMSTMASQITSLAVVYSTVYSRRRSKRTSKLRVTGLCEGNSPVTGEFPTQRSRNAENVPIWWHHQAPLLISMHVMPEMQLSLSIYWKITCRD